MSSSRRVLKVAEAIRESVSMNILTDLQDPRVSDVTVTFVEVTSDLRNAKVHVSIMGDEKKQNLALHGLRSAAGYLQSRLGDRIETRYTPKLEFVLDQGVKKSLEVTRILGELAAERAERESPQESSQPADEPAPEHESP